MGEVPSDPTQVQRVLLNYLDVVREFRLVDEAVRMHRDRMLTWAMGLMGGGLFAVVNLAGGPCSAMGSHALVLAASPWAAGVLFAVLGRIASTAYSDVAGRFGAAEAFEIRGALGRGLDADSAQKLLGRLSTLPTRTGYEKKSKWAEWISRWLYYLTLVALLGGMISVFRRIATC